MSSSGEQLTPWKIRPGEHPIGRAKGTPNKLTSEAKEAIELAFEGIGGVPALIEWAQAKRDLFYTLIWTKIIPKKINLSGSITLENLLMASDQLEVKTAYEQLRHGAQAGVTS